MEVDDACTNIRIILTALNSPNKSVIDVVTLRVYLQCLIRLLNEIESGKAIDISASFTESKEESRTSLLDDSRFVFHKIINAFLPNLNDDLIKEYHEVTNIFLNHRLASYPLKIQLLEIEDQLLSQRIEPHLKALALKVDFYEIRYKIIVEGLTNNNRSYLNPDKLELERILNNYLSKITIEFILKGEILQLETYLRNLLENSIFEIEKRVLLSALISCSKTFHLYSSAELLLLVDDYEDIFSDDKVDEFRQLINFIPTSMDLSAFTINHLPLNKSSVLNKTVETVINFSIPQRYLHKESKNFSLQINEECRIDVGRIASVFQDPIFQNIPDYIIGGIGWHQLCDLEPNHNEDYCHITVIIKGLYTPHITLNDSGSEEVDFSEESARIGRKYYPHKEYVIEVLRRNFNALSSYIDLNLRDININLFSNYIFRIIDKSNSETLNQQIYALTNPDSYSKSAGKFIEQVNSRNMSSSLIDIRTLLSSTIIKSEKNLAEFIYRLFDVVVKSSIELHGNYTDMWNEVGVTPKREPEIQTTILSFIRYIFKFMGINIDREVIAATGQIDFLVSKTINNNDLVNVAVELKLVRYPSISNIENGINVQLPIYMKDKRCNYGVFIALWFKTDVFENPTKFGTVKELETHIKKIKSNHRIMEMIIDCTKPISPSKLKAIQ